MNDIIELMELGQWAEATERFKKLNVGAQAFQDFIEDLPVELIKKYAILGYFARDFKPSAFRKI